MRTRHQKTNKEAGHGYVIVDNNGEYLDSMIMKEGRFIFDFYYPPAAGYTGVGRKEAEKIIELINIDYPERILRTVKNSEIILTRDYTEEHGQSCPKCNGDDSFGIMTASGHVWSKGFACFRCGYRSWIKNSYGNKKGFTSDDLGFLKYI